MVRCVISVLLLFTSSTVLADAVAEKDSDGEYLVQGTAVDDSAPDLPASETRDGLFVLSGGRFAEDTEITTGKRLIAGDQIRVVRQTVTLCSLTTLRKIVIHHGEFAVRPQGHIQQLSGKADYDSWGCGKTTWEKVKHFVEFQLFLGSGKPVPAGSDGTMFSVEVKPASTDAHRSSSLLRDAALSSIEIVVAAGRVSVGTRGSGFFREVHAGHRLKIEGEQSEPEPDRADLLQLEDLKASLAPRRFLVDVRFRGVNGGNRFKVKVGDLACETPCSLALPPGRTILSVDGVPHDIDVPAQRSIFVNVAPGSYQWNDDWTDALLGTFVAIGTAALAAGTLFLTVPEWSSYRTSTGIPLTGGGGSLLMASIAIGFSRRSGWGSMGTGTINDVTVISRTSTFRWMGIGAGLSQGGAGLTATFSF